VAPQRELASPKSATFRPNTTHGHSSPTQHSVVSAKQSKMPSVFNLAPSATTCAGMTKPGYGCCCPGAATSTGCASTTGIDAAAM